MIILVICGVAYMLGALITFFILNRYSSYTDDETEVRCICWPPFWLLALITGIVMLIIFHFKRKRK